MILEKIQLDIPTFKDWTLDGIWSGGPDTATDWQVVLLHRDGAYQVRDFDGSEGEVLYEGTNLDAAVEHFLMTVRKQTMEAMGVAYSDGTEEREGT